METEFGGRPTAGAFIPSPQSEAVANELQELSLQPAPNLLPVRERKDVLQLKLQQRRSREELISQGIMTPSSSFIGAWSTNIHMPALKSSAVFHEQRRCLERARTEDYLKRKIRARPERSELIRMHILEETSAEPSLQAKQLQLKRARIADDLNDKISHRPGPMELIHKNILPVHSSIKQAIIETRFPKASGDNSSCDEDSNYSLSPEQPVSLESPLGLLPLPSPPEMLAGSRGVPSPRQVSPPALALPPLSGSSPSFKLTNGTAASSAQRTGATSQIKCQPKPHSDRSAQRHKKPKDNKPKIKKLKYHQYIPPDQKGDKEPPPHLDSSYAKILQQQQLFLQLQILSQQQQQHYNYHTILPAPPKPQRDQQPSSSSSSSSSSISTTTSSPPRPVAAPSKAPSNPGCHIRHSAALRGTKPVSLPPNLDEMKVAELKSELKLRSLPVSGTKNDLIERLRTYQELNGGCDTTCAPTAGGITGPGAEGAGRSTKTAAATTNNNYTSQQQQPLQCHDTSSLTVDAGSSAATRQQPMTCGGAASPPTASLTHSACSPGAMSLEDTSFNSDPLVEMMSPHITHVSLPPCSAAQLATGIKEEPKCSALAPCQLSVKQKHCLVSSTALTTATPALVGTMDKDRMLQEKDKQIEELTRMLRQKQRLVEVLRMQLEHVNQGGPEPPVLVRVKQEPPDGTGGPLSFGHSLFSPSPSPVSSEVDVLKVTVKQEAIEAEEVACETTMQLPEIHGLPRSLTQSHKQVQLQIQPEQMSTQAKQQHVRLQQTTLQLAQQQAIQKLLLQQQRGFQNEQTVTQNRGQTPENLQKLSQQRKKKSHKQHLKQLQLQQQLLQSQQQHLQQQSKQHQQQMQLKQQILLKQQKSLLQQQQQTKQLQQIQIQTKMHLKQQQEQQKQQAQQQPPQVSHASFNQQPGSAPSFPLDLLKSNSGPTLVTDGNGNHFLVSLTSHITESQGTAAPGSKATNQIALQRLQSTPARLPDHNHVTQIKQSTHERFLKQQEAKPQNVRPQVSVEQPQQDVALCLSAPPSLQPFFKHQETASSGNNTSSPPSRAELCPGLDVLFSPLSPASNDTAASSPDDKNTEHEEDFIDIILQTGEMSTTFNPAPDPSLDCLNPHSSSSSPHPSPFQLMLSPPMPSFCDTQQSASSMQSDLQTLADAIDGKQHLCSTESGRLEDFLESTTGKPLLGVEPGGLMTLIDDLHSQMLCTPSILDHPLSPMDTFDLATEGEHGLDGMDWLDLTMGGERGEETSTLAPLCSQTPPSVFSTDFLDSSDLPIHWDSCL
ncbi:LOW QUALITY PROTEIN: myocardin-related transcription factor B-like [Cyclopterus lumpus]|uniref:LOW QUALITY PROTEIN: myocardin-related transcription factor B-like n=1 Tax=Cyclopterus lumpus TaxID=8103 RepID=UPI001486B439|nr:LOW QUALITY PROTEIN: myocardin-related transcription factor B-like [Cyclopterus lumpus]